MGEEQRNEAQPPPMASLPFLPVKLGTPSVQPSLNVRGNPSLEDFPRTALLTASFCPVSPSWLQTTLLPCTPRP